jgi:HK97 family phage major capsid protein
VLHVPQQTAAIPDAEMLAIDASPAVGADISTRLIEVGLRTAGKRHKILRHGINYSQPSLVALYTSQIMGAMGRTVSRQAYYGDRGTANPNDVLGLFRLTDIQRYRFAGAGARALPTWLHILEMLALLTDLPLPAGEPSRRWLMHPRLEETMMALMKQYADPADGLVPDGIFWNPLIDANMKGILAGTGYETNQGIPIDGTTRETHIWLGDWSTCYVVIFGPGMEMLPDPFTDPGHRNIWTWLDFNAGTIDPKRIVLGEGVQLLGNPPTVPLEASPPRIEAKVAVTA